MVRVLILAALICVCGILSSSMAEARPDDSIALRAATTSSTLKPTTIKDEVLSAKQKDELQKPRVLEEKNQRYLDGNYEYRYSLSNGVTRYEKSYWTSAPDGKKVQAHKGFFSHPLPNDKYITVFYTADATGYHQDSSTFTKNAPLLPKHLQVPESEFPIETSSSSTRPTTVAATTTTRKPKTTTTTTTTTRKPRTTTTRKPRTTTTRKPRTTTTTKKSLKKPSNFNWIY